MQTLAPPPKKIHWNDDLNSILINLLEIDSNAILGYIVKFLIHRVISMLLEVKCIIVFNTNMNLFLFYFIANKQLQI